MLTYIKADWNVLTGQPLDEAQGHGWLEKVHPKDRDVVVNSIRKANEGREKFILTYRLKQKDGRYLWVISRGSPSILPGSGEFIGYLGATDIIERDDASLARSDQVGEAGRLPASVVGAPHLAVEDLADQVIHARKLAMKAQEQNITNILDLALLEIGFRLARKPLE